MTGTYWHVDDPSFEPFTGALAVMADPAVGSLGLL
jgi:hypothetical protein